MRKQSGRIDSLDHPIGMGVVHHRINFLLCLFCELPLAGMALAIEGGGQHWEIPFPKEFFYASQLQSPPSPSATLRSTFPTALEEVAAISDDGVWHCVLGAMAAERDGFSCLARDRWEMAEDMADRLGFGEGVKEFHSHAIAHLLPPSEAAVARMRRCWEKGKRRRDLERCLILLARLDRKEEARRLLGQQLDDDRAGGVVDPQLALLGALLWPEDTDQFGHLLRRALIEDGPASVRVAVLRLLVRQPGGEDLSPFLAVLPEAADRELGAALRLARLELALRDGDWPLAKTLAGILFRENGTDSERREGFLRLWLWLALERVPTDYGKIAALLRNSDSTGTERRTIHLALAAHYLRQGNCSLAQRFLGKCGPLDQKELALQTRIAFANGQFAVPLELLRTGWASGQPPSEELLLEANAFYANSALSRRWTQWLAEILTEEPFPYPEFRPTRSRLAALNNAINLNDLQLIERLFRSLVAFSDDSNLSREESAELQLLLTRLAMVRGDRQELSAGLALLRENFPDGVEAMNSYFLASEYFEGCGDGEAACAELRAFLDRYRNSDRAPEALFRLAYLLSQQGNSDGAIGLLEELSQSHRESTHGRLGQLLAGDLLRERQEWEAAEVAYRSLLIPDQSDEVAPFARLGLAKCLLIRPSPAARREALECLEWLSADSAMDADFALEVTYALALALRREGDRVHARQVLQKSAQNYCEERNTLPLSPKGRFWLSAIESLIWDDNPSARPHHSFNKK